MSSGTRIIPTADFGVIALDIQGVQKSDAGWYICSAKNLAGTRDTDPAELKIIGEYFHLKLFSLVWHELKYTETMKIGKLLFCSS